MAQANRCGVGKSWTSRSRAYVRIALFLLVSGLASVPVVAAAQQPVLANTNNVLACFNQYQFPQVSNDGDREQTIANGTNALRAQNSRSALERTASLDVVARNWARQMARDNSMVHNPNVSSQIPAGWSMWAENIAWNMGYGGQAAGAMACQWFLSAPHRANILSASATHFGVGVYTGADGKTWGVQVFSRYAASVPPVFDVGQNHPFRVPIAWMIYERISTGYSDGTFRPVDLVSRQAFAAFLHRASGSSTPPNQSIEFTDVPPEFEFAEAIRWLVGNDITAGYEDGSFRPGSPVSRQAVAAFLYRAAGSPSYTPPSISPFIDVPEDHTFYKEISWLVSSGVASGYDDGTFRPGTYVTRQALSAFLHRAS